MKAQINHLKKALHKHPEVFPYLADCYFKIGRTKEAANILTKGLDQYPENYMGWIVRGNVYREMGELEQAEDAFERALQHDNNIPFAHEQCGELALESGKVELYVSHLKILNHLIPMDGNIQSMLQAQALRLIAVESGLYTEESVQQVMPGTLRQKLKNNNLLPKDIERQIPRKRTQPFSLPTTQTMTEEDMMIDASHGVDEAEAQSAPKIDFREEISPDLLLKDETEASDRPMETSEDIPDIPEKMEVEDLRYPLGRSELNSLGGKPTKVSWAETVVPQEGSPLVEVSSESGEAADEDLVIGTGDPQPDDGGDALVESELPDDQEGEPRDSPIMRLLRGEMQDKPISRELHFRRDRMETHGGGSDSVPESPTDEKESAAADPETSLSDMPGQSDQSIEPSSFAADLARAEQSSPPDLIIPADAAPASEEAELVESEEESAAVDSSPEETADEEESLTSPDYQSQVTELLPSDTPSELSFTAQSTESGQDDSETPPVDTPQQTPVEQTGFSLDALQVGDQPEISSTSEEVVDPPGALSAFSGEIKISSDEELPVRAEFGGDVREPELEEKSAAADDEQPLTSSATAPTSEPPTLETEAEIRQPPDSTFESIQADDSVDSHSETAFTPADEVVPAGDLGESEPEVEEPKKSGEIESEQSQYPTIERISPQEQILEDSEDTAGAIAPDSTSSFTSGAVETPPESAAVDDDQPEVEQSQEVHESLAEVAREVTDVRDDAEEKPPTPSEPSGEKRIATKTLAELHASQENWAEAIDVYEELLQRFPTNIAYQKRLEELRARQISGSS